MLEMINQPISIHWETASIYVQLAIHCKKTMGEWGEGGGAKKNITFKFTCFIYTEKCIFCLERVVRNYFSWCYI